jgi:hypothetical protein
VNRGHWVFQTFIFRRRHPSQAMRVCDIFGANWVPSLSRPLPAPLEGGGGRGRRGRNPCASSMSVIFRTLEGGLCGLIFDSDFQSQGHRINFFNWIFRPWVNSSSGTLRVGGGCWHSAPWKAQLPAPELLSGRIDIRRKERITASGAHSPLRCGSHP